MPEKVTISHRGSRYEIGLGKRYYAVWAIGAPRAEPLDRWPESPEGWSQAWARFTAIETPGTIAAVPRPRPLAGLASAIAGKISASRSGSGDAPASPRKEAAKALVAVVFLVAGVLAGIAGLFPDYFTGQSLASAGEQLWPHLLFLLTWAAAAGLILSGRARVRPGALLGTGLSAVTLGLFISDLATGTSEQAGVGAGMVISLLGWLACTAGSVLALSCRLPGPAAAPAPAAPATVSEATVSDANLSDAAPQEPPSAAAPGEPASGEAAPADASPWAAAGTEAAPAAPPATAAPAVALPAAAVPAPAAAQPAPKALARPRRSDAGTIALLAIAALGAALTFLPSWDRFTLLQASSGASQTVTAGDAFAQPGWVIFGDVLAIVALLAVAVLAALWRPARHGGALVGGALIAMAAQAVSALFQASEPASAQVFGITPEQAQANGLTVTSGLTGIFWVYVIFVIGLAITCAWLLTAPADAAAATQARLDGQASPDAAPAAPQPQEAPAGTQDGPQATAGLPADAQPGQPAGQPSGEDGAFAGQQPLDGDAGADGDSVPGPADHGAIRLSRNAKASAPGTWCRGRLAVRSLFALSAAACGGALIASAGQLSRMLPVFPVLSKCRRQCQPKTVPRTTASRTTQCQPQASLRNRDSGLPAQESYGVLSWNSPD